MLHRKKEFIQFLEQNEYRNFIFVWTWTIFLKSPIISFWNRKLDTFIQQECLNLKNI